MPTLEIHDCFEPYYAGRKPFEQVRPPVRKRRDKSDRVLREIDKLQLDKSPDQSGKERKA